jgi:N-acyl-D-aspartate/D-glutamate deacylase
MNSRIAKRIRKQYRKQVAATATKSVRHLLIKLARARDILGIVAILETITIIALIIALLR